MTNEQKLARLDYLEAENERISEALESAVSYFMTVGCCCPEDYHERECPVLVDYAAALPNTEV